MSNDEIKFLLFRICINNRIETQNFCVSFCWDILRFNFLSNGKADSRKAMI